jgi:hypothetical protein
MEVFSTVILSVKIFCRRKVSPGCRFLRSAPLLSSPSSIARETSNSVEVNCSLNLTPAGQAPNLSGSNNSIADAEAANERVGLGNVFKQFFKWVPENRVICVQTQVLNPEPQNTSI